jgi:alpha-amylase
MCTKYFADGDVHKYFNPYDSPYESYINFMNILGNLQHRCARPTTTLPAGQHIKPSKSDAVVAAAN